MFADDDCAESLDPLTPPRALGGVSGSGCIKRTPEDFVVREILGFEPSGCGQHVLVHLRKRSVDTQWVAAQLASCAAIAPGAVGYAGLKDRHAVAEQWFSLDLGGIGRTPDLSGLPASIETLAVHRHDRKLRIGALDSNAFEIRIDELRGVETDRLVARIAMVRERGVPNYFGPQRFGRDGANLELARRMLVDRPGRGPRAQRAFAYSAARSYLFNAVLARRVAQQSWDRLTVGDLANRDGANATFAVEAVDADLRRRERRLEIHPTGPLWGSGELETDGEVRRMELAVCGAHPLAIALEDEGVARARRPLRLVVRELEWSMGQDGVRLSFRLRAGSHATSVLRELFEIRDAGA